MKVSLGLVSVIVVLAVISVASAQSEQSEPENRRTTTPPTLVVRGGLKMFKLDRECAMVGGICMDVDDCDPEYLSTTKGLCPSSSAYNVQCCYRYKRRENSTCDQYQGECMSSCHPLIRHKTKDCGDQWCCTLV